MREAGWITTALATLGAALLLVGMPTEAHRDRGPNDACRREIGASLLHITLYQTQFDPVAEYCEEVPRAGKALMVVDVTPGPLRTVPLGLEIIATDKAGQSQAVVSLSPRIYERGVMNTEIVFAKGTDYVARVMVELEGQASHLLAFPIQVAAWYKALMVPGLIVGGVLVFVALSAIRYTIVSRQHGEAPA